MTNVTYVSPTAPKLKINVSIDNKKQQIQFDNKELHLDVEKDKVLITALDDLIATRSSVSQLVQKVDPEVALQMALAHKAQMASQRGTMTGPVTSADQARARMVQRDEELARQGASPEELTKMQEEIDKDLELTTNSEGRVEAPVREGFVPDHPEPVETEPEETKKAFENLLGKG